MTVTPVLLPPPEALPVSTIWFKDTPSLVLSSATNNCITVTPVAPGIWVELTGATAELMDAGGSTGVDVAVVVAVKVGVEVAVLVVVWVAVKVVVLVVVAVGEEVTVGVLLGVEVAGATVIFTPLMGKVPVTEMGRFVVCPPPIRELASDTEQEKGPDPGVVAKLYLTI